MGGQAGTGEGADLSLGAGGQRGLGGVRRGVRGMAMSGVVEHLVGGIDIWRR